MMNHYQNQVCKTVVSLLTALFLYSCNASLGHHNMMEEVHSNDHPLSTFDQTTVTRAQAIAYFPPFRGAVSGGSAVVYDLGNGSVLRTRAAMRLPWTYNEYEVLLALRAIKNSNKALPIVDMYSIFKIDTGCRCFQPGSLFNSSSQGIATPNNEPTCAIVLVMQKVEVYDPLQEQDFKKEVPFDFNLANLFLQYHGIQNIDQPKTRNLGYILQDKPVQYTFKINDTLKTYQVVGQPAAEGTNQLYKKTIMFDYEEWKTDLTVDHSAIQKKLDELVQKGEIVRLS